MFEKSKEPFCPKYEWSRFQQCLEEVVKPWEWKSLRASDWYWDVTRHYRYITEEDIRNRVWEHAKDESNDLQF